EEVSITGLAAMPKRFPGQYADDETGFSYNYFRDYEPTIGRYIESDRIGLKGGINTYAYAEGNPTNLTDPTGKSASGIASIVAGNIPIVVGSVTSGGTVIVMPGDQQRRKEARSSSTLCSYDQEMQDKCWEECQHLLPSPSGDLQGSEFRKCWRECMGSLK